MTRRNLIAGLCGLLLATGPVLAAEKGWFGMSIGVSVNWRLNLDSAVVNAIRPGTGAERAGVQVGDTILAIDNCQIPGCGAFKARGLMQLPPGQEQVFSLRRPDGSEYEVRLVSEPVPSDVRFEDDDRDEAN